MSNQQYFSDREEGPKPRTSDEIPPAVLEGFMALIRSRLADGSFGGRYPDECPDGGAVCGCDRASFVASLKAEVPDLDWPPDPGLKDHSVASIMDMLEFCHRAVAEPRVQSQHSFYNHRHLAFDAEQGQARFREEVNRILARRGMAYSMGDDGRIKRILPEGVHKMLTTATFATGEAKLDELLETARGKLLDPDRKVRIEGLEKLWDAFERLKTIEHPEDKRESIQMLLDKAATEPNMQARLEKEMQELTDIGNDFHIRHTEVGKPEIEHPAHVDYLFWRLFALISLLLRATGRDG